MKILISAACVVNFSQPFSCQIVDGDKQCQVRCACCGVQRVSRSLEGDAGHRLQRRTPESRPGHGLRGRQLYPLGLGKLCDAGLAAAATRCEALPEVCCRGGVSVEESLSRPHPCLNEWQTSPLPRPDVTILIATADSKTGSKRSCLALPHNEWGGESVQVLEAGSSANADSPETAAWVCLLSLYTKQSDTFCIGSRCDPFAQHALPSKTSMHAHAIHMLCAAVHRFCMTL